MGQRVLIVEDVKDLANTLQYFLQRNGYEAEVALTGARALTRLDEDPLPDLLLLDLMLPDVSGIDISRALRRRERTRDVPVLMLTAKGEEADRVAGLEAGADDYVVKPFSMQELLLRVRALLRRSHATAGDGGEPAEFGLIRLDPASHRAWVGERELKLTVLEFKLLSTFLARRGRAQTRERLLADVWGIHADVDTRTVDTHIKRLREKLGEAGDYVETLRGVGYRFRAHPNSGTP